MPPPCQLYANTSRIYHENLAVLLRYSVLTVMLGNCSSLTDQPAEDV